MLVLKTALDLLLTDETSRDDIDWVSVRTAGYSWRGGEIEEDILDK